MPFQRILVAVDAEPVAARAADLARDLARSTHGKLALIHVIDPGAGYAPEGGVPAGELYQLAEEEGRRFLETFRPTAVAEPPPLEFVPVGSPAAEIVKAAREWAADLIVIGSHGRAGVKRVLLGSVAEAVMRHAPCPVLVVRAGE